MFFVNFIVGGIVSGTYILVQFIGTFAGDHNLISDRVRVLVVKILSDQVLVVKNNIIL